MNTSQCQNFNLETHPEYLMSLNQSDRYLLHQGTQGHPSTDSGGSFGFRGSATSPAGLEGPWGREGKGGCGGLWTSFAQIRSGEEEKEAGAQGVL